MLSPMPPPPTAGRVYSERVRTGIGDASPSGRIRLDAIARWLQDGAYADVVDAGWDQPAPWLVRRCRISVARFPRADERLELETWCSGLGGIVAERRTAIRGDDGARVDAVAVWVSLDPVSGRPLALDESFRSVFAPSAAGRRARAGLRHPPPPADAQARPWTFRAADLDRAAHVNNAVYWATLEEELLDAEPDAAFDAEIEHRDAGRAGPATVLSADRMRWIVDPAGSLLASIEIG